MARPESAIVRAEHRLRDMVREAHECGNPILPSLRRLAREFDVSRATVLRAMRRMRRAGLVVSVPRRGYAAAGPIPPVGTTQPPPPSPSASPPPRMPRWRALARLVEQEILDGSLAAGSPLPSVKELQMRYGCGYHSLLHALRSLREQGRLTRRGNRYEPIDTTASQPSATIVLVTLAENPSDLVRLTPRSDELLREIERGCSRRRLALRVREFSAVAADPQPDDTITVGYIVSTIGSQPLCSHALRAVLSTGLPVALLDETGCGVHLVRKQPSPLLRCFVLGASELCGRLMGEHLLSRGHRRILFIAPHDDAGTRIRWQGVCDVFRQAGFEHAVAFRSMVLPRIGHMPEESRFVDLRTRLENTAAGFSRRVGTPCPESAMRPHSIRFAASVIANGLAGDFFRQALHDHQATAWVAYNDTIAVLALHQLREQRIRLARELSLVGFDDTLEAFAEGLSSYSFGIAAVVNRVLEHLLAPKRATPRNAIVEIPGMVLERQTSGSVRVE